MSQMYLDYNTDNNTVQCKNCEYECDLHTVHKRGLTHMNGDYNGIWFCDICFQKINHNITYSTTNTFKRLHITKK